MYTDFIFVTYAIYYNSSNLNNKPRMVSSVSYVNQLLTICAIFPEL